MNRSMASCLRSGFGFLLGCLGLLTLALFACACARAQQLELNAQVGGDAQRTRFVAFLSKPVDFRIYEMTDPFRIVIDLPETDIQVPGGKQRSLVLSSRSGLLAPGKSRIVIDLVEPALVESAQLLPPENGAPARLVIDLLKASYQAFLAASRVSPPLPAQDARKAPVPADPADKRPLIVIDPGHGGVDAGAVGRVTKTLEKDVTFAFCKDLVAQLENLGRYRILMTRQEDVFVPLDERADIASERKADLLISIHADTLDVRRIGVKGLQEVRGATVYTLSDEASDEQAKLIAQSENNADVQAGVASVKPAATDSTEISAILGELESRGKKNRSQALANYLVEHLKNKMKFNIRPHRSANLRVLKAVGVPAVLIELGYLSNDEDEKLLTSKDWRAATAASLAEAVNAFMMERQARMPL